ncbi:MAG: PCI domain-containing protein [Anaerolineae bacterium]
MSRRLRRTLCVFLPAIGPLVVVMVALGVLLLGTLLAVFYGMSAFEGADAQIENGGAVLGIFVLPLVALLFEIAGLWERAAPAKTVLGVLALGALALSNVIVGISLGTSDEFENLATGFLGFSCLCSPVLLLATILPVYGLVKTPAHLRELHQQGLEEDAVDYIRRQGGEVTYRQLARALDVSEERVDPLLRKIVKDKKLQGLREVKYRRFYTVSAYAERQLTLLGIIDSRGTVSLQTLSEEFGVPQGLVEEWIYALVREGKFTGYLDWDNEIIYSREAEKLQDLSQCPNCGAEMTLAGKGTTRCEHCGTEVFLPGTEPA